VDVLFAEFGSNVAALTDRRIDAVEQDRPRSGSTVGDEPEKV
jgi:hypothetical protein